MYRRKLKMLNQNKLIVSMEVYYGTFLPQEAIMLVGVPVHKVQELGITHIPIYTKYCGLSPLQFIRIIGLYVELPVNVKDVIRYLV